MEKNITKPLILLLLLPLLTNCSYDNKKYPTVVEFEDKDSLIFTTEAFAGDDLQASNETMIKAIKTCGGTRQNVILLDYSVKYLGYTKQEKKLIKTANKNLNESTKTATPYDYKAMLKFKCHWPVKKQEKEDEEAEGVNKTN